MKKPKVFLGGTCNNSTWRDKLIPFLKIDYFNPVVPNWTPECQAQEILERQNADIVLYVITPKMTGVYSIAEAVDDSHKCPDKVVFCFIKKDDEIEFSQHQLNSINQVGSMLVRNGVRNSLMLSHLDSIDLLADVLNNKIILDKNSSSV